MDPHDFLIAGAFDLGGHDRALSCGDRIASALLLGQGGTVRAGEAGGAWLGTRQWQGRKSPALRRANWQPLDDGSYILLAGRIAHRRETCARLHAEWTGSFADLYGRIYQRHGDDTDTLLTGDYTVIQWWPANRTVRIARSAVSRNPIHVWRAGGLLVVGSIPRALFAAGAPSLVDDAMVGDMMLLNLRDGEQSWYAGQQRVATGTAVTHDPGGARTNRFWSLDHVPPVQFRRDKDYVEAVDEQFGRAVDAALEGAERPAMWLSGGLDSQGLASYLVPRLPAGQRLPTFTAIPGAEFVETAGRLSNERAYVRELARMYPAIDAHFVDGKDYLFGQDLDAMNLMASWPIHNPLPCYWNAAVPAMKAAGCDAVFTASSGNLHFSYDGQAGYPTWLREGRLLHLLREVARAPDKRGFVRRVLGLVLLPNLPHRIRRKVPFRRARFADPLTSWSPLRADFAQQSGALARADIADHDVLFDHDASARAWRASVYADTFTGGAELTTGFALVHGIAERDPLAYQPLLELCAGIPDDQYLRNGETRWLARRLLQGRIPEAVRIERRDGVQNADWALRMAAARDGLLTDLRHMARDARLAGMLDFPRLIGNLESWDASQTRVADYNRIAAAVGRGYATARFIQYAEGRNAG